MKKFNPKTLKPIKLRKGAKLYKLEPAEFFKQHDKITRALSETMMEGDIEAFQEIISAYLSIINKEELSRKSKVPIATIRRMAAGSNYNIETLLKITAALHKAAA